MYKKIALSLILCLIIGISFSCANKADEPKKTEQQTTVFETKEQKVSYAAGYDFAKRMSEFYSKVEYEFLAKGIKDALEKKDGRMTEQERMDALNQLGQEIRQKAEANKAKDGEKNIAEGKKFLEENAKKEGVKTTASGLQYKVIKEGDGPQPKETDTVKVNYRGTLINGTEFDSSYKRGTPATFPLNRVIKGWTEGLQLMKVGAKYEFYIPSDLAYGSGGAPGGAIGPNSTL